MKTPKPPDLKLAPAAEDRTAVQHLEKMKRYQHTDIEVRIIRAVASMPYGGCLPHIQKTNLIGDEPLSLENVATYLEAMQQMLAGVAKRNTQMETELQVLQTQRNVLRSALGFDQIIAEIRDLKSGLL
jgi:hypothetical protein